MQVGVRGDPQVRPMRGKAVSILIAATFVIFTAQPAHAGEGDELEASYVAAGFVDHSLNRDCQDYWEKECPVRFPGSVTVTACAGDGGLGGSGVDGIGGVRFCDVGDWRGGDVNIQITDISGPAMEVVVTCPFIEGGYYLNWSPDKGLTSAWKTGESSESLFTFFYEPYCSDEFYILIGAGNAVAGTVTAWV